MQNIYEKQTTAHLAEHIYKNAKMGADAISEMLPKIKDGEEKKGVIKELTRQYEEYERIASESEMVLISMDITPKEENMIVKISAKAGIMMNTLTDSTTSHIAEMVIEGLSMGIVDTTKRIREAKKNGCDESVLKIGHELISFQEKSVDEMKKFL